MKHFEQCATLPPKWIFSGSRECFLFCLFREKIPGFEDRGKGTWVTTWRHPPEARKCKEINTLVKNLPAMQETQAQSLGQEDSPGGGHGNPLQHSCLESPMDRGAWWAPVLGVTGSELSMAELAVGTHSRGNDRAACLASILQSGRLCAESGTCLEKSWWQCSLLIWSSSPDCIFQAIWVAPEPSPDLMSIF